MSFDNSRFTFNPSNDYCGVVMEQGRVQTDADWNEWLAELSRRIQAGTLDTLGGAVYPSTTPFAFKISASAGALSIGAGRMYVDGLLAENHGPLAAAQWDPALEEMSGAPQISGAAEVTVGYTQQPHLPGAALPAGNGPFLAYLDVWRRAVTYLEDPNLVDKAIAVDTSGRLQTVWQVKLLDVSGVAGVTCATSDSSIPAWQALIQPSAGQLSTGLTNSTPSGPCSLTSNTGYTGQENQFYRVEIHQAGTAGGAGATFKWSRDDASVATAVTAIAAVTNTAGNPASQLSVESMGRDQVLGFAPGNWIEITDDYQELNGQPGELHQIDSVNFAQKTITLDSTVSATSFPLTSGQTNPLRHTRIQRWDQGGQVYEQDGVTVWATLVAGGSGDIPVPPAGTTLILENGITVAFDLNPAGGLFHTGDFWTFAARTADGSVETLQHAYPRGIHHHYARLAVVTFPSTAADCRVEWPPSASGAGCDCCCSVTVQPGDLTGAITLQTILDRYQGLQTPTEICLMPGTYSLTAPLRFQTAHSNIGLKACQDGAVVIQALAGQESQFADGLVVLDSVSNVSLRGIYFAVPLVNFTAAGGQFAGVPVSSLDPDVQAVVNNLVVSIGVRPVNCSGLTVENCQFGFADFEEDIPNPNAQPFGVGIFASGQASGWRVSGTTFEGVGDFLAGILVAPEVVFASGSASASGLRAKKEELAAGSASALQSRIHIILNLGTATPQLAAGGGTVLPSSLNEAVFEENSFSGLTIGALVLGATQTVQFARNQVEGCTAGFWILSPLDADLVPYDPNNVTLTGLSIAMGYPLPQGDTTPATSMVTVPAAPASVRIYAGKAAYTDSQSNQWLPDVESKAITISGGALSQPQPPAAIADATPSTSDQALYQSERWGSSFSYTFNALPTGFYQTTLRFAEIFYTDPKTNKGMRIFDVAINGAQVLTDLDVVADAGGADIADDWTFNNIVPNAEGEIVIQFTGTASPDHNAKIGAAELEPQWDGVLPRSLPSSSESFSFYWQLAQLAQQGFVNNLSSPLILRVNDNEMQGLSSVGVLILGDDSVEIPKASSVIMTGNRVDAVIPAPVRIRTSAQTSSSEVYFTCAAAILAVTRCMVSANLLVNDAANRFDLRRACFVLDDGTGAPLAATVPPPEIMVSANVFQGTVEIEPARYPANTQVPYPMNSWDFLNTLIP
jgi:hypothetical protein